MFLVITAPVTAPAEVQAYGPFLTEGSAEAWAATCNPEHYTATVCDLLTVCGAPIYYTADLAEAVTESHNAYMSDARHKCTVCISDTAPCAEHR